MFIAVRDDIQRPLAEIQDLHQRQHGHKHPNKATPLLRLLALLLDYYGNTKAQPKMGQKLQKN